MLGSAHRRSFAIGFASLRRDKRDRFAQCRDARTVMRDRCYASQRDGHDTAISEADTGRANCAALMVSKGC